MKRKNSINATVTSALLAAVLLPAGCSRGIEPQGNDIETVNFAVGVADCVEVQDDATKAAASTSISSFKVAAFNNSGSDHNQFIAPGTNVNVSGTSATTGIRWTKPYAKVFYAYANLPENGSTVTPAYDGQTLAYTVPATAATQNDVLLAAVETDGGTSHNSAALPFKHPLTQVSFKIGKMENITSVSSITINGAYASGSVKQSSNGSFGTWSHTGTQNVSQTPGSPVTPPSSGTTAFGVPFMLIPQSGDITISVTAEKSGEGAKTLTGTISGVNWQAGKATSYTIGFDDGKGLNFKTEVTAWVNKTAEDVPMEKDIVKTINNWGELLQFKEDVESGVNMAGMTITIGSEIYSMYEPFSAIYDKYGVLDGATIDGNGCPIHMPEGELTNPYDRGHFGFFSTISSDDVTIKNLSCEFQGDGRSGFSATESAGGIVGLYTGTKITVSNCYLNNCTTFLRTDNAGCIIGGIVGCSYGDTYISGCQLNATGVFSGGNYYSFMLGYASGNNTIQITDCTIDSGSVDTQTPGKLFGAYLGGGEGNLNITISGGECNCCIFPGASGYYYTGDGYKDSDPFGSYHFHAIGGNLPISGATVTITGMDENACMDY